MRLPFRSVVFPRLLTSRSILCCCMHCSVGVWLGVGVAFVSGVGVGVGVSVGFGVVFVSLHGGHNGLYFPPIVETHPKIPRSMKITSKSIPIVRFLLNFGGFIFLVSFHAHEHEYCASE